MYLKTVFHETQLALPFPFFLMKEPNFADAVMHLRKTPADETNAKKYVSLLITDFKNLQKQLPASV